MISNQNKHVYLINIQLIKACGWYSLTFTNWAPIFDWCVEQTPNSEDTCLEEIGYVFELYKLLHTQQWKNVWYSIKKPRNVHF